LEVLLWYGRVGWKLRSITCATDKFKWRRGHRFGRKLHRFIDIVICYAPKLW
jgi:hypothetical protein